MQAHASTGQLGSDQRKFLTYKPFPAGRARIPPLFPHFHPENASLVVTDCDQIGSSFLIAFFEAQNALLRPLWGRNWIMNCLISVSCAGPTPTIC